MKRVRGFSILELLIVIAVLGILGAVTAANLQSYIESLRASESARGLSNAVSKARNRALQRSAATSVLLTGNAVRLYDADGELVQEVRLPHRALVTPAAIIRFTGRGLPDHQYVFTVTAGPRSRRVVILPTGKVVLP